MRFATTFLASVLAAGTLLVAEPAAAITPDDVVSSSSTTVSGDCHGGQTSNVYYKYALFVDDTFTLSLTNCNAHYAQPSTWLYGSDYTKVNSGNGGTGVRNPNTYALGNDQQCLQQNSTNSWVGIPYGFSGFTATMTDSVTSSLYTYVYDHDAGGCTSGNYWRFKQLVYSLYPVTPTVTAAFSDPSVLINTDTTLTVTLTNTQRYRTGVRANFTNLGLDIALPSGANMDTASAGGTCGGTLTATAPGGVPTLHYTGGAITDAADTCTITVPIAFSSAGTKTLSDASLTASTSNKSELINDLSASIDVEAGPALSPATQSPSYQATVPSTPTTAFTPSGFSGSVTYSISPTLPDGLLFDTSTGVISGTPSASQGLSEYTVTATDGMDSATATISIEIAEAPPTLSPATQNIDARVGSAMTPTVLFDVSAMPCVTDFAISPELPQGLELDPATGVISGTPTVESNSAEYVISYDCGVDGTFSATVTLSVGSAVPDFASLVNTGLAVLGPVGLSSILIALGAPFFFVSERFRRLRAVGEIILYKSAHVTIMTPARFFDRLRRK